MIVKPDNAGIQSVIDILRNGGIVGYPTETVYGLGCNPWNMEAVKRIQFLKGRDSDKPMIILIPQIQDVDLLTVSVPNRTKSVMKTFWPGSLTLVLKGSEKAPEYILNENKTIGLRISSDPVCRNLLKKYNHPIVSTSANPSGENPARSAEEVEAFFGDKLDAVLDGGLRKTREPSTVVDLSGDEMRILRTGAVKIDKIRNVWRSF